MKGCTGRRQRNFVNFVNFDVAPLSLVVMIQALGPGGPGFDSCQRHLKGRTIQGAATPGVIGLGRVSYGRRRPHGPILRMGPRPPGSL